MTPAIRDWIAREPSHREVAGSEDGRLLFWFRGEPRTLVIAVRVAKLARCANADAVHAVMRHERAEQLRQEWLDAERDRLAAIARQEAAGDEMAWLAGAKK